MRVIFHLVPRAVWEQAPAGDYRDLSLEREGFIHCSSAEQVETIANLFFADVAELLALHLDAAVLGEALRDEVVDVNPFRGASFPHVYGALPRHSVVGVTPLQRGADGRWTFFLQSRDR